MFLSLVSLITLIVGAIGVSTAIHAHIQQRMDSIAIMKCLGARSSHLMRIYLIQTVALGLGGGLSGSGSGPGNPDEPSRSFWRAISNRATASWDLLTAAQGIGIAVLATLLFTLPPLLAIRRIRPSIILRREMERVETELARPIDRTTRVLAGRCFHLARFRRESRCRSPPALAPTCGRPESISPGAGRRPGVAVRDRVADAARAEVHGPSELSYRLPARHREFVSPWKSRAIRAGGARHRCDVYAHRVSDRARRHRADASHRAARDAEHFPHRHRAQGSRRRGQSGETSSAASTARRI